MECTATPCASSKPRKRCAQPEKWKRNVAKKAKYSSSDLPKQPTCQHKKGIYNCHNLSMRDLIHFHEAFYKYTDKETQDAFLLKFCTAKIPKRKRPRKNKYTPKKFQTKFNVYSVTQKAKVTVCQKAFLDILHITKHRVQYVTKMFLESGGKPVKEKRGGDHKSHLFAQKKAAVMLFINMFHVDEPHYCRGHSGRKYLPAELSINKMWKIYNNQAQIDDQLKVKKGLFRKIFNTKYNLGFGSPRTDVCSVCIQLLEKIKRENDETRKQALRVEHRVHKLESKAFFNLVKEEQPDLKTLSFDCEKNLPLPKTPDQITYYSRQIYLYNCTVVEGSSKSQLTKSNVFAYCWTEDEYTKGSNEIASIVYHRLRHTDFTGIKTVRLIADGCPGQNKNSTMIAMCSKWLCDFAPDNVKEIQLIFPVVGHSFIPPDRVFAHIEKEVRKLESIILSEDYLDIIGKYSTIIRLGTDCEILDFKRCMGNIMKPVGNWHFKFKISKCFFLRRSSDQRNVVIQGEVHYNTKLGVFKKVSRNGKSVSDMNADTVPIRSVNLKPAKIADVKKLLCTHFGENWENQENLLFFKQICDGSSTDDMEESEFVDYDNCEPTFEDNTIS